jgi:hypothetical protein
MPSQRRQSGRQSGDRILTLHPAGKKGVNIEREKYLLVRKAILGILRQQREVSFGDLLSGVQKRVKGKLQGSSNWYGTAVKLDLEARGEVQCIRGTSGQRIRPGRKSR